MFNALFFICLRNYRLPHTAPAPSASAGVAYAFAKVCILLKNTSYLRSSALNSFGTVTFRKIKLCANNSARAPLFDCSAATLRPPASSGFGGFGFSWLLVHSGHIPPWPLCGRRGLKLVWPVF